MNSKREIYLTQLKKDVKNEILASNRLEDDLILLFQEISNLK